MKKNIIRFNFSLEKAIIDELSRTLAFGCVNKFSNGSHTDMTYDTFILSSKAIRDGLENIDWENVSTFEELRIQGLKVERSMLEKTGGVNTHKGLVFMLMFLAYFYTKYGYIDTLERKIANFSSPLKKDYIHYKSAKKWNELKIKDIRYFPLTGFSELIKLSKVKYKGDYENTLLSLKLIAHIDDTTTINRSKLKTLSYVQDEAKKILRINESDKEKIMAKAKSLNQFYLDNNLSSGGVADVFTVIKLLSNLEEEINGKNLS